MAIESARAGLAALALTWVTAACSDGATRIAFDIEEAVKVFQSSGESSTTIKHVPERVFDGCGGPYTLQLSERSSLVLWCKDASAAQTVSSHATTYHLRFVQVPQTFKVEKAAGEPTYIDIVKRDGKPVVTALR